MSENTPEAIDAWRWERAWGLNPRLGEPNRLRLAMPEYRRLVRENVLPPAEPIGNDLPKWAQDEAERLARAEPAPKWGVHDSPRSHYALARLIAKQGKPEVAEPDQDTLDTRAVLDAWDADYPHDGDDPDYQKVKAALTEIKARVRREAIMALHWQDRDLPLAASYYAMRRTEGGCCTPNIEDVIEAIKSVYGK